MKWKLRNIAWVFFAFLVLGNVSAYSHYAFNQNLVIDNSRIITPNIYTDGIVGVLNTGKTNILRISNQEFLMPRNTYLVFWFEEGNYQLFNGKDKALVFSK
ncbi:MAG TPA: hypothetical protein PLX15_01420 [Candidatus Woesearchaeota archaeon]|nr:hypothetical protein [Candidatus Woesearchaeota archaeon]